MKAILILTFLALFASLVDAQCNPSPCGINTRCEVSFFYNEHWSKMKLKNLFHNDYSSPNKKIQKKSFLKIFGTLLTLQMFTGIYKVSVGKSKCGDFKFMGIARYPKSL